MPAPLLWTAERKTQLAALYPVTESWEALLREFPFATKRGIEHQAHLLRVAKPRRPTAYRRRLDHGLFDTWAERSAYILGYLEADGHFAVRGPRAGLAVAFQTVDRDRGYLTQLREWIGSDAKIGRWTNDDGRHGIRFVATSRQWRRRLAGKYRIGRIPECLPAGVIRHYVRGYFDGDGSVYRQGSQLLASFVFNDEGLAHDLRDMVAAVVGGGPALDVKPKRNSDRCWYFRISGQERVASLGSWLYDDAEHWLARKRTRFETQRGG